MVKTAQKLQDPFADIMKYLFESFSHVRDALSHGQDCAMGREEHQPRIEKVCSRTTGRRFADACEPLVYGVAGLSHRTIVFVVNASVAEVDRFFEAKKKLARTVACFVQSMAEALKPEHGLER